MAGYKANAHHALTMLAEGLDGKKAGPVRTVASEPQGLHNLKDKERNGLHCSEVNGHAAKPGAPLALPPSVSAVMDKIEEGHTEHCESSNGEHPPRSLLETLLACLMVLSSRGTKHFAII